MKKTILIISASILFVFAATGCEDVYKVSWENSNTDEQAQQTINVNPSKTLAEIVSKMNGDLVIDHLVIIEDGNRELDFQLVPSSGKLDDIVSQYQQAYQKNIELIKKLLPDNPRDLETQAATDQEREALDNLNSMPKTPETIMVSSVTLTGSKSLIDDFKQKMEE